MSKIAACKKWHDLIGVLCDKRMSIAFLLQMLWRMSAKKSLDGIGRYGGNERAFKCYTEFKT